MEKELTDEKSPLYKRKTFEMSVGPLDYDDALGFLERYNAEDKAAFLSIMGRYPYYLSSVDTFKSLDWNLSKSVFNEYGIFFSLPDQVLSNSTNALDVYNAILQSISFRHRSIGSISSDIHEENSKVSKYMDTLVGIGIVEKRSTFMGTKKTNYYEISDPLIRFWYSFVFRNQERIRIKPDAVFSELKGEIKNYTASNSVLGRSVEIDGVAESGNEMLIVDCKYRTRSYSRKVFEHLLESSSIFPERYNKHFYIFSKSGFADDMKDITDAMKLTVDDLFRKE